MSTKIEEAAKTIEQTAESSTCPCNEHTSNNNAAKSNINILLYSKIFLGVILWYALYSNLDKIAKFLTYNLLNLTAGTHFGSAIEFLIFEIPKVLMLLIIVVFFVGIIRSFFTAERTRAMLAGRNEFIGNVMAATLGIVTPFCSCSAIPLFIGFVETGVPLGVTFSFLISAPMINEVALVLLYGMFGIKVAALYLFTGLFIAILAGYVIGILKLERYIEEWVFSVKMGNNETGEEKMTWNDRINYAVGAVHEIVYKVWIYIVFGIAIGAGIHGYVPENEMAAIMGKGAWWSVPAAVLLGVPMYSNAAGIIPIVKALMEKGAALGTVLAFMMAVIGLSLPEIIILKKVLKWQLIAVFVGVVSVGILIVGYLFNYLI